MGASESIADDNSVSFDESDWAVIPDGTAALEQPNQMALLPRDLPQLALNRLSTNRALAAPNVSQPGMIKSLPMVSQAKCRPLQPPSNVGLAQPRSLQFDSLALSSNRPLFLEYDHQPPAPGDKRQKTSSSDAVRSSATSLIRTKTPSETPFLVNAWSQILTTLGSLSQVFIEIGNHQQFQKLACVILDAFAASTLHRYLTCIQKFFTWCRDAQIAVASISVATILDVLTGGSRNSGMKGSTILKALQWCRKQAAVQSWSFLDSPLIQSWQKSKIPTDRQESLPLPLYVVVQWERRLLQANIPQHELLTLGSFLLMIWSGLRFSDLQRVTIASVVCSFAEIRGISWRTKTCSKGQPWGACAAGFLSVGTATWLSKFVLAWDEALATHHGGDRDFVLPQFREGTILVPYQPMSYPSALHWFRSFLTIPWKRNSETAQLDTMSYTIHGMKATILSWASQLCHQGFITEEMRRLQGHHKPIQHSVSLYSRDDVNGQLELQRRLIQQILAGWRPITPQHRGAQMPAAEPVVHLERFRKDLDSISLTVLHWDVKPPTFLASQVDSSSSSATAESSSSSGSSDSEAVSKPPPQLKSDHILAIGLHRFVHHAMVESSVKNTGVSCWNDTPVQTACGKKFAPSRIHLMALFSPPAGTRCMHRGCQQWLDTDTT